jgi:hypothetical protein
MELPPLRNRATSESVLQRRVSNQREGIPGRASHRTLPYFLQVRIARVREALRSGTPAAAVDEPILRHAGPLELALLRRAEAAARAADHRMTVLAGNLRTRIVTLRTFGEENGAAYLEVDSRFTVLPDTDERSGIILGNEDKQWNAQANRQIADSLKRQMTITHQRGELDDTHLTPVG